MTPAGARELRPLGIGEVLDRAVSLCIRYFVPLALVYVVFAVPEAIGQFYAGRTLSHLIAVLTAAVQTQAATGRSADPASIVRQLSGAPSPGGLLGLSSLFVLLIAPLAFAALTDLTAAKYLGRASSWSQSYRIALGRWLPLIGVNLIFLAGCVFAYVVAAIVVLVLGLGIGALYAFSHPLGLTLGIPLTLALTLAVAAAALVMALALQVAYFTCVIERAPPIRALATSFSRVFGGIGLPRALLFGAAYLAIVVGVGLVALVGEGALAGLVHSDVAASVYATLLRLVTAVFTTAFVCIFYYDLRVREEGFDLQLAAQEIPR